MLECNYGNICKQFKHHALTSALRIFFASENAGVLLKVNFLTVLPIRNFSVQPSYTHHLK